MARPRKTQQTAELQWRLPTDTIAWMREQAKAAGQDPGAWLTTQLEAWRQRCQGVTLHIDTTSLVAGVDPAAVAAAVTTATKRPPSTGKAKARRGPHFVIEPATDPDRDVPTSGPTVAPRSTTTGKQAPAPRPLGRPVRLVEPIPKGGKK